MTDSGSGHLTGFFQSVYRRASTVFKNQVHPEPAPDKLWPSPQLRRAISAKHQKVEQELVVYDEISEARFEWHIAELAVKWIMAGRDILEEQRDWIPSEVLEWKLRVSGMLLFGAFQVAICCAAQVFWSARDGREIAFLVSAYQATIVLLFALLWLANAFRVLRQQTAVHCCTVALVLMCLLAPSSLHYLGGWHWSSSTLIWNLGAPVAALVLLPHPLESLHVVAGLRVAVDVAVFSTSGIHLHDPVEPSSLLRIVLPLISNAICPFAIAVSFRRALQENRWRALALQEQHEQLAGQQKAARWLIFSMIPPVRARLLPCAAPAKWYTGAPDQFKDCSMLQMDVSGFTVLSSKIGSEELVDLINALFTSIDFAAECIGQIWKIELIGDCYKAVIGGPSHCEDHAYRATVFAYTIVEIVTRIADRLSVQLKVRVGVHSGEVTAAVIGKCMPRYLFFGRDCEVVNRLEMNAETGGVLLSAAAAERLGPGWEHTEKRSIKLADGSEVGACAIASSIVNQKQMLRARHHFKKLGEFHRHYCRSRYHLDSHAASHGGSQGAASPGGAVSSDSQRVGRGGARDSGGLWSSGGHASGGKKNEMKRNASRNDLVFVEEKMTKLAKNLGTDHAEEALRPQGADAGAVPPVEGGGEKAREEGSGEGGSGAAGDKEEGGGAGGWGGCVKGLSGAIAGVAGETQLLTETSKHMSRRHLLQQNRSFRQQASFKHQRSFKQPHNQAGASAEQEEQGQRRGEEGTRAGRSGSGRLLGLGRSQKSFRLNLPASVRSGGKAKTDAPAPGEDIEAGGVGGRQRVGKGRVLLPMSPGFDNAVRLRHEGERGRRSGAGERETRELSEEEVEREAREALAEAERRARRLRGREGAEEVEDRAWGQDEAEGAGQGMGGAEGGEGPGGGERGGGGGRRMPLAPLPPRKHRGHGGGEGRRTAGKARRKEGGGSKEAEGGGERRKVRLDQLRPIGQKAAAAGDAGGVRRAVPAAVAGEGAEGGVRGEAGLGRGSGGGGGASEGVEWSLNPLGAGREGARREGGGGAEARAGTGADVGARAELMEVEEKGGEGAGKGLEGLVEGRGEAEAGGSEYGENPSMRGHAAEESEGLAGSVREGQYASSPLPVRASLFASTTSSGSGASEGAEQHRMKGKVLEDHQRILEFATRKARRGQRGQRGSLISSPLARAPPPPGGMSVQSTTNLASFAAGPQDTRVRRLSSASISGGFASTQAPSQYSSIRRPSNAYASAWLGNGEGAALGPQPVVGGAGSAGSPEKKARLVQTPGRKKSVELALEDDGAFMERCEWLSEELFANDADKEHLDSDSDDDDDHDDHDDSQHAAVSEPAATPSLQRSIVRLFGLAAALCSALQALGQALTSSLPAWLRLFNLVLLVLILGGGALAVLYRRSLHLGEGVWTPRLARLALLLCPVALGFSVYDSAPAYANTMVLWSFLAVLVKCASSPLASRQWSSWLVAYLVLVAASAVWVWWTEEEAAEEAGAAEDREERGWFQELLLSVHHLVPTTLFLVPLALSWRDAVQDEQKEMELMQRMNQQQGLEKQLLAALVPRRMADRLARGDAIIADAYHDATVLFIYVCDYDATLLKHGEKDTIAWMNRVLTTLDDAITDHHNQRSGVTKVETFNNFLLIFSGLRADFDQEEDAAAEEEEGAPRFLDDAGATPPPPGTVRLNSEGGLAVPGERHAEECLGLAVAMLDAVASLERPDGLPTAVKVGLNSGPLTAGVIGTGCPRFSIFGDTVNTASRMASSSQPCTSRDPFIHMSEATRTRLPPSFQGEMNAKNLSVSPRGDGMEIKGKGRMQTYCLAKGEA